MKYFSQRHYEHLQTRRSRQMVKNLLGGFVALVIFYLLFLTFFVLIG